MSGPQSEKVKKELQVLFTEFRLNLIIECNKTIANYLDITLNSLDGTYKPYQKPETTFTKNLLTFQISSNKFQLQSKHEFKITHQTKQFSVSKIF